MESVIAYFEQQGVLGIIIIMLLGLVVWQQKRIDAKDTQIDVLQDKRKSDADAYTTTYINTTKEMVGTQRDGLNAINLLQRSVEALATAVQGFINGKGGK